MDIQEKLNNFSPPNRKRRAIYVFCLTGVLILSSLIFAGIYPDALITKTIVESSYSLLTIVVGAYLAASTVDYTSVVKRMPSILNTNKDN